MVVDILWNTDFAARFLNQGAARAIDTDHSVQLQSSPNSLDLCNSQQASANLSRSMHVESYRRLDPKPGRPTRAHTLPHNQTNVISSSPEQIILVASHPQHITPGLFLRCLFGSGNRHCYCAIESVVSLPTQHWQQHLKQTRFHQQNDQCNGTLSDSRRVSTQYLKS